MSAPGSYSQWVDVLDCFEKGEQDEEVLRRMEWGSIGWTTGVTEKLAARMFEVLEIRLKRISKQMNEEFGRQTYSEASIIGAMLNARNRFALLGRFVSLPALSVELGEILSNTLQEYVKDTQTALENSAKNDHTGQLLLQIKHNSLIRFNEPGTVQAEVATEAQVLSHKKSGTRRVLF